MPYVLQGTTVELLTHREASQYPIIPDAYGRYTGIVSTGNRISIGDDWMGGGYVQVPTEIGIRSIYVNGTEIVPLVSLTGLACQHCPARDVNPHGDEAYADIVRQFGHYVCQECRADCEHCNALSVAPMMSTVYVWGSREEQWCDGCYRTHARDCQHCSDSWSRQAIRNEGSYCNSCNDIVCASCSDDMAYCDHCEEYACSGHDSCGEYDNGGVIQHYSYKPSPIFHGDGPLFLGMELETGAATYMAEWFTVPGVSYCKSDSSVDDGFEIVTHPMTLTKFRELFPWDRLKDVYAEGHRAYDHGIHVHVSRTAFRDNTHARLWMHLLYGNKGMVEILARRSSAQWASFDDTGDITYKAELKMPTGGRYHAVNAQNVHTYEVRVFRSTLKKSTAIAALSLVDASVRYAETLPEDTTTVAWGPFVDWLLGQPDVYPELIAQIQELGAK